jgi:hypothetical protein
MSIPDIGILIYKIIVYKLKQSSIIKSYFIHNLDVYLYFFINSYITEIMQNGIITNASNKNLDLLGNLASSIQGKEIVSGVSKKTHQLALESLMAKIQDQKFFFIVDLSNLSIIHANGISDWLGYDNETFTLSFYPTIVHPNHLDAMLFLGKSITEVVKSRKIEIGFMKEKFTIDIALKHADGHYILVRRALSYWDFDANMQMPTAYINEFSILENFEEEYSPGIRPRTTDFNNNRVKYFEEALRESSCNLLEKEKKIFCSRVKDSS